MPILIRRLVVHSVILSPAVAGSNVRVKIYNLFKITEYTGKLPT